MSMREYAWMRDGDVDQGPRSFATMGNKNRTPGSTQRNREDICEEEQHSYGKEVVCFQGSAGR